MWCRLSLANLRLDRDNDALEAAGRAAALAPDNDWPHRLASHALESLGRKTRRSGLPRGRRLAPHVWQGHARFAATLSAAGGDLRLARQAAGHAVQLAPFEPDAHSAMGLVALRQGDHDTAERAFRHVLSLQPEHHSALNNLAVVQLRKRDLDGALSGFSAAIRSEPQQEVARRNVDVVERAVLYRAQWFVFIAAYGTAADRRGRPGPAAQVADESASAGWHWSRRSPPWPSPAASWSLRRIPPALRPYARSLVRRNRLLLLSAERHRRGVRHPARGDAAGPGRDGRQGVPWAAALAGRSPCCSACSPAGRPALAQAVPALRSPPAQPLHHRRRLTRHDDRHGGSRQMSDTEAGIRRRRRRIAYGTGAGALLITGGAVALAVALGTSGNVQAASVTEAPGRPMATTTAAAPTVPPSVAPSTQPTATAVAVALPSATPAAVTTSPAMPTLSTPAALMPALAGRKDFGQHASVVNTTGSPALGGPVGRALGAPASAWVRQASLRRCRE